MRRRNDGTNKFCPRCKIERPLSDFGKNASSWDGLQPYCRECQRQYGKERNAAGKSTDRFLRYRLKHPKRVKQTQERYRNSEHGSVTQWSITAARRANATNDANRQRQPKRTREEALAATEKYCPRCKTIKSMNEFGVSKYAFDGHFSYCKPCSRDIECEKARRNPDKHRREAAKRQANYRKRHPDRSYENEERYNATKKGQLKIWSNISAKRAQETVSVRSDGRVKSRPGGDITAKQLRDLWQQQNGKCVLTGRALLLRNGKQSLDSPSIDRIDSKKGYELNNIRLITYQANCAKLFGTDEQLREFCRAVLEH